MVVIRESYLVILYFFILLLSSLLIAVVRKHKLEESGSKLYCRKFKEEEVYKSCRKDIIEMHLRNAIENDELSLKYQPQYDIFTKKIVGYEALVRWNSKELGYISPAEFISVAEESSLIFSIGNWVLKNACSQNSKWIKEGFSNIMAVNVSPIQFEQKNFIDIIKNTLEETKLEAQFLELEITESTLIKSFEDSIDTIEKLKEIGITISLDDFGTGYSSLGYLKKLPINNLKIDKCFIDDIVTSKSSRSILQSIIELAHTINLKVIAEGIETNEQNEILKQVNCRMAQGFFYSKPLSSSELEEILLIKK